MKQVLKARLLVFLVSLALHIPILSVNATLTAAIKALDSAALEASIGDDNDLAQETLDAIADAYFSKQFGLYKLKPLITLALTHRANPRPLMDKIIAAPNGFPLLKELYSDQEREFKVSVRQLETIIKNGRTNILTFCIERGIEIPAKLKTEADALLAAQEKSKPNNN